ncbi:type IV pilin [Methanorbis furvi]|uniref:Archaeal Type IV pilin N-terminal domain-containing protein n=1 Tax=Methanorbis furvi TaxID=3028299 RepID=A0AAE4SB74_9EURY|nr:hypothetical protein [Methanocorpusculaceae archaeon Ag1]
MRTDNGISPVIAVVVLIGLVVIASAIIGLTMLATMENVSGTPPDVRFQVSADGVCLYHAGGDALPLRNLVFYDTSTKKPIEVKNIELIKGGGTILKFEGDDDKSFELNVWETGDKIRIISGKLSELSIVGPDSRNHPALLYMGANAMVMPIGDMVPDEWIETVVPVVPTGPEMPEIPLDINPGIFEDLIQIQKNNDNKGIKFDEKQLIINGVLVDSYDYNVTNKDEDIWIIVSPEYGEGHTQNTTITVNVYSLVNDTYELIYSPPAIPDTQGLHDVILKIPNNYLIQGDLCYVTIYREGSKNGIIKYAQKTVVIRLIH